MSLAENLKKARKEAGLSQAKLAEKADISQTVIYQYENGLRNPKIESLNKIADALNVNVHELTGIPPETQTVIFQGTPETVSEYTQVTGFNRLLDFLDVYGISFDTETQEFIFRETGERIQTDKQIISLLPPIAAEQIKVLIKNLHFDHPDESGRPESGTTKI